MPPKQKTPFEKYVQERKQLRRSFNSIFNEASSHFAKTTLTDDEIALVKGSLDLLYTTFEELHTLERELRVIALEEIKDETEQNEFLDEGDAVVIQNKGKLTKLELFISKLEKPVVSLQSSMPQTPSTRPTFSQSKLPELNLPTFDCNIMEWFGFWERFQSQVGKSPDLPNVAKFTYLMGQLR